MSQILNFQKVTFPSLRSFCFHLPGNLTHPLISDHFSLIPFGCVFCFCSFNFCQLWRKIHLLPFKKAGCTASWELWDVFLILYHLTYNWWNFLWCSAFDYVSGMDSIFLFVFLSIWVEAGRYYVRSCRQMSFYIRVCMVK